MNLYVLLAVAVAWLGSVGYAAWLGKDYAEAQHAKAELEKKAVIEQVREANREFADAVATETAAAISKIRIVNRTITNEVRNEREVHHVLNDAACAVPASTVGVLNAARAGTSPARPRPGGAAPAVPGAGTAADGPPATTRGSGSGGR